MPTEDDTFARLKRRSIESIIRDVADNELSFEFLYEQLLNQIVSEGAEAGPGWDTQWVGWTFEELRDECIRRRNDSR